MKKLAIFDFDGTLFNSVDDVVDSFNKALEIHDFPTLTREEYFSCLGGNIGEITSLVLGANSTPQNVETLKKTYLDIYNSSKKEKTLPFEGSYEILKKLQNKNVLLAVNSNRLNYSLNEFVEKYYEDIDFLLIEGQDIESSPKPDPSGAFKIIEKSGLSPDESLYIGDSKTDIKTAENAGIDCVIVRWGYGSKNEWESENILESVSEFDDLLKFFSD